MNSIRARVWQATPTTLFQEGKWVSGDPFEWRFTVHRKLFLTAAACVLLAGCISTQEMPLAPNMVRLDTRAGGYLFVGQTTSQTMRKAAEATLTRGYTHFRLDQAQMGQGSEVVGVVSSGNAMYSGNRYGGSIFGSSTTTAISGPTANVGVTVVMFRSNEAGAQGAFEATQVLRQYGA